MKVAFFAGHAKSILLFNSELVAQIVKNGHEVVCIAPEAEYKESFEKLGASFISVDFNRHSINPLVGMRTVSALSKLFKEQKFDVYYGFTAFPSTYGVFAAKKAGIEHKFVGVTGAGKIVQKRKGLFNKLVRVALTILYRKSLRKCDNVFFLNDDNIHYFVKHKIIKAEQAVKLGGSGVNLEKHAPKPLVEKDYFLYIGALLKFKGIMEYMEAAREVKKKYPDAEFHIVGAIDDRVSAITQEELDEYTKDSSVIHEGYQSDVKPFLENCRCFVLPSYSEGIPTSVLEAMATGRPIITTDAPGCKETVIDGENGFLVPVKNVDELVEKMVYVIEHKEETEKMALRSLKIVREKFDVKIVNETMLQVMGLE